MQATLYISRVHIGVHRGLKLAAFLWVVSFYLSSYCFAMDDAQFEQLHQQKLQDVYWAQVAEYQLKEKLIDQSDNVAAQTAIQQKACASAVLELKYYDFVILNLSDFNRYRQIQGFNKIVYIEELQQDRLDVQHRYKAQQKALSDMHASCE